MWVNAETHRNGEKCCCKGPGEAVRSGTPSQVRFVAEHRLPSTELGVRVGVRSRQPPEECRRPGFVESPETEKTACVKTPPISGTKSWV